MSDLTATGLSARPDSAQFEKMGFVGRHISTFTDDRADDQFQYHYRIVAVSGDRSSESETPGFVRSSPSGFISDE